MRYQLSRVLIQNCLSHAPIYTHIRKGKKAKNSGGGSQKQSIIVVKYRLLPSAPLQ